jgi:hypothetical protein
MDMMALNLETVHLKFMIFRNTKKTVKSRVRHSDLKHGSLEYWWQTLITLGISRIIKGFKRTCPNFGF